MQDLVFLYILSSLCKLILNHPVQYNLYYYNNKKRYLNLKYKNLPQVHQCNQTFYKLLLEEGIQCHLLVLEAWMMEGYAKKEIKNNNIIE